ncbi:hypothetical protein KIN20_032746 [Parelaphostrongylus tenuis]|uniref:Uncharacterized protein n=1 Tax=Parelaphostrongylus tenuis TaxID=148309 RepID=A0AAD5R7R2_PARTN|nr:hypothetical protein KIN20_032746 [Parelaphostrongylus tenuis]
MLLENQKRVLLHLQKENEDLRRRLSLAVRDAVRKTDIESNDEKERKRSPSVDSYPVIDNDVRAVIPVTLNLLVEGENHEPMQLFASGAARGANFRLMEGTHYRLRLDFFVQRDGVRGFEVFSVEATTPSNHNWSMEMVTNT